jgi:hypothetical protein
LEAEEAGGIQRGQTQSNPVKPDQSQTGDSQESEQIQNGPLRGLLVPPEWSKPVKPLKLKMEGKRRMDNEKEPQTHQKLEDRETV